MRGALPRRRIPHDVRHEIASPVAVPDVQVVLGVDLRLVTLCAAPGHGFVGGVERDVHLVVEGLDQPDLVQVADGAVR